MKSNSRREPLVAIVGLLLCASGSAADPRAGDSVRREKAEVVQERTWKPISELLPEQELLEGSFRGRGLTTGTEYTLHLLRYLNQQGVFIAILENPGAKVMGIGILKQDYEGAYSWQGLCVDSVTKSIDVPMAAAPLMRLQVAVNNEGKGDKVTVVSTSPKYETEAIDITEGRSSMLRSKALIGEYRSDNGQTITLAGVGDQLVMNKLFVDPKTGASSASMHMARKELPGVYAARATVAKGYQDDTAEAPSLILVPVDGLMGLFQVQKPRLLVFEVDQNGFLESAHLGFMKEK